MSSKDLSVIVKTQKQFIKELLDRLENKNEPPIAEINGEKILCTEIIHALNDDYFVGLNFNEIIELAKKSIRLTSEYREFKYRIEKVYDVCSFYTDCCKGLEATDFAKKELAIKIREIVEELIDK